MMLFALLLMQQVDSVRGTAPALPPDVSKWLARYEECEHWLGEEPYDAKRRRQIDKAIKSVCKGIDEQRTALIAKYPQSTAVDRVTFEHQPLMQSGKN